MAALVSPLRLAPSAPTCAADKSSTCVALNPPTAADDKPDTSVPNAFNCAPVKEAACAAVTPLNCAAVSASNCVALSAFKVAPATCPASRLAMAATLRFATRAPRAPTSAAVKPSTCTGVSAATRSVPVPIKALNCVRLKAPRPAAEMPANCPASRLAMAALVSPLRLAPSAPTCSADSASTCVALNPPTAAADKPDTSVPSAFTSLSVKVDT